jgi:nucleotide-binding universal stress UspA family protein
MKRYQRILVPMDWSELSKSAYEQALGLAKMTGGQVTLLHIMEPVPFFYHNLGEGQISTANMGSLSENKDRAMAMLKDLINHANEPDVKTIIELEEGNVAEEIIRRSSHFDIVIMGTIGHNALATLFMGSTAEKVSRHACCPVMLIREIGSECRI